MVRLEASFLLLVFALSAGLVIHGWLFANYPFEALLFPGLVAVAIALSAALRFVEVLRERNQPATVPHDGDEAQDPRSIALSFAVTLGVLPAIWLLGFQVGLPLYVLIFLIAYRTRWPLSLAISAATALFINLLFTRLLAQRLPTGWLF
jgi:hypothetical protein